MRVSGRDWEGWMGSPRDARRRYLRGIVVERPGDEAVIVATDLLDAQTYPAEDLLAVHDDRWQIETVFQQITEVFELQRLIGCTPQATEIAEEIERPSSPARPAQ